MIRTEDLHLISKLGQALYANPAKAQARSIETLAAISTLSEVSDTEFLERALDLLLKQAERDGVRSGADRIANPFFRLEPRERFVLFLLHSGRISYKRLARLLESTPEIVAEMAWTARTRIASSPEIRLQAPHPTGSSLLKQSCPEFDLKRPWTQKLLDDEMANAELTFLQNHTAVCPECQRALSRTRELYYAVEKWIPASGGGVDSHALGEALLRAARRGQIQGGVIPADLSLKEALGMFFSKRENQILTALIAVAFLAFLKLRI